MEFQIEKMTINNLPEIMEIMENARQSVKEAEWFVSERKGM